MAGDDPRRHRWPCRRCRARLTDPSPLLARRSALWRERWSLCRWHWRAIRSGGCDGTLGQDVEQEAPDEFVGRQRHRAVPRPSVAAVVLEAEDHATVIEGDEAAVRDGDAV